MANYNFLYQQSLYLSPEQQDLLLADLSSNNLPQQQDSHRSSTGDRPTTESNQNTNDNSPSQPQANSFDPSASSYFDSPIQDIPGSGHLGFGSDESPFLDFDPDVDFDFQGADQLIGDIPDYPEQADDHEPGEKRKSMDGVEDEGDTGKKRRESEDKDKAAKKPGRKPLTSEPTSKRKAQNRAAQRAFRERKEKHLKDLETKVEDLEKASESTNHENGLLRAQVERLQVELREYRKRLSWLSSGNGFSTMNALQNVNSGKLSGLSNNDFFFDFPKFGDLPGNHIFSNGSIMKSSHKSKETSSSTRSSPSSNVPGIVGRGSANSLRATGQSNYNNHNATDSLTNGSSNVTNGVSNSLNRGKDGRNGSRTGSVTHSTHNYRTGAGGKNEVSNYQHQGPTSSSASNSDSPSSSSESQHGQASSMGTSPEPSLNSPSVSKPNEHVPGCNGDACHSTIDGEKSFCEQLNLACGNINNPVPAAINKSNDKSRTSGQYQNAPEQSLSFDWLAQQNGGNFDPVLFNDYREPQDAVLSQEFGTFFNDAFPLPDLGSPFPNFNDVTIPLPPKKNLVAEIDNKLDEEEVVPGEDKTQMLSCTKIWDRLQSMEKFRNGEIDVDSLCTELRTKARCSEGGVVVNQQDVEDIMGRAN